MPLKGMALPASDQKMRAAQNLNFTFPGNRRCQTAA
jgi:hypothetical protein